MRITPKLLGGLAATALVLLIITGALYAPRPEVKQGSFSPNMLLVQGLSPEQITEIIVHKNNETINLIKQQDDQFVVKQKHHYPASTKEVNDLITKILDIRCAELVSESKAAHKELGVEKDNPDDGYVEFRGADGKTLCRVLVGKAPEHGSGRYVRLAGKPQTYISTESIWFYATPTSYMDTKLLELTTKEIEKVEVKTGKDQYVITRGKDDKGVLADVPKGKRPKNSEVDAVFSALSYVSFSDVIPVEQAKDIDWKAQYTCQLKKEKHTTYILKVGVRKDKDNNNKYYLRLQAVGPTQEEVQKSTRITRTEEKESLKKKDAVLTAFENAAKFNNKHQPWCYEISEWKAKNLMKPLAELLEDENKEPEEIAASHILIAYKGAERAGANVTRSKEEARKLAEKVLKMAKEGKDFAELARKYSDGPSKSKGGDLGTFKKGVMHKNFEKAAWKLKVNEICESIVETPFGFHIIKRTK